MWCRVFHTLDNFRGDGAAVYLFEFEFAFVFEAVEFEALFDAAAAAAVIRVVWPLANFHPSFVFDQT